MKKAVGEGYSGGSGVVGHSAIASARPDGYTIGIVTVEIGMMHHQGLTELNPTSYTPLALMNEDPPGVQVKADSPYKTFKDYVEAARKQPGTINYGSTGTGSSPHLLMEELAGNAKVQFVHVPFKGNADLQSALLGGHVMAQSDATGWDKFVDSGEMRLLVTFGEQRTKRWPDVPTAQDLGYNVVSTSPYGLVGPKGMDPAIMKTLHDAFKKAMDEPRHQEVLAQLNQAMWYRTGDEYRQWAAETYAKDKALIDRLGLGAK